MLRKTIMVAIAVGVVAAMALPAAASANWKHHSTDIQQDTTFGLTGQIRHQGSFGGIECQITSRIKLVPGTTGVMETFVPHPFSETLNCDGLGGLGPCEVHSLSPQAPNWTIHISFGSTVSITTQSSTSTLVGGFFCLLKHVETQAGTITATPSQPNTMSGVQLSGSIPVRNQNKNGTKTQEFVTVSGNLSVELPNANTYSL